MPRRGWAAAVEEVFRRQRRAPLGFDPLRFPKEFGEAEDQEVVAFFASALAFGNVRSVHASVGRVVEWMGPRPAGFCEWLSESPARESRTERRRIRAFRHRWIRGGDVERLAVMVGRMRAERGSLEAWFAPGVARDGRGRADLAAAIEAFRAAALPFDPAGPGSRRPAPVSRSRPGPAWFFPSPRSSAAKRTAMFLRWAVRRDRRDLALWDCLHPRDLVVPLDTHLFRLGRRLGLTRRATPGWAAAVEITRAFARLDPEDPVKYDFPLSRLGIVEGCPRHPRTAPCELCRLLRSG